MVQRRRGRIRARDAVCHQQRLASRQGHRPGGAVLVGTEPPPPPGVGGCLSNGYSVLVTAAGPRLHPHRAHSRLGRPATGLPLPGLALALGVRVLQLPRSLPPLPARPVWRPHRSAWVPRAGPDSWSVKQEPLLRPRTEAGSPAPPRDPAPPEIPAHRACPFPRPRLSHGPAPPEAPPRRSAQARPVPAGVAAVPGRQSRRSILGARVSARRRPPVPPSPRPA